MTTRAVRRRLALAVLACSTAAVTGCGSSELTPELHPGSAAVVGDERIAIDEVDDFADGICDFEQGRTDATPQVFPMAFLRAFAVQHLVRSEVLDQYAEEHELEVDRLSSSFQTQAGGAQTLRDYRALVEAEVNSSKADGETAEIAIDLFMAGAVSDAVTLAAGVADDSSLSDDAAVQRGQELIEAWRAEQEIEVDPRFGQTSTESLGYLPPDDTLSVLAGKQRAEAEYFDANYLEELPASQRCGTPPDTSS